MRRVMCCVLPEAKKMSHAMFLLVSLPVYNAPDALWKTLRVGPRTWDLVLSAKQWKMSLQPFHNHSHSYWRHAFFFFCTHTVHMLLLHSGTLTVWISSSVLVLIMDVAVMEAIFSIFPQITESSRIEKKTSEDSRQESLKVNITSSLNPFQRKWDFPYFSMLCLDPSHWRGNHGRLHFPCWLIYISQAGKEKLKRTTFKKADYLIITSVTMSTF